MLICLLDYILLVLFYKNIGLSNNIRTMFQRFITKIDLSEYCKLQNHLTWRFLIGILLLAAVLRFQNIFLGVPIFDSMVHSYHPDEPKILQGAFNFPYHILTNNDLRYPTFYHYFLGTLSIPAKLLFKIEGWSADNYQIYISVFGRFISILLSLGSIFLTFILAKKLYDEKVGLLSALFLSLSFYHVQNSAWATLDVPNSFFFILTTYLAFKMYEKPTLKFYLLTGISFGILIGTKYNGATAAILILILHYYKTLKKEKSLSAFLKVSTSKKIWLLFFLAGIVFILTTPGIILKPGVFVDSLSNLLNLGAGRQYRFVFDYSIFKSIFKNFITVTDPLLTISMIFGLVIPLRKSWDKEIPIIIVVIIFFIAFGVLTSRQLIAVLPLTSILGAQAIFHIYKKTAVTSKPIWIFLLSFWIVLEFVYNSIGIILRKNDTRTEAAYYIEQSIPLNSTIGAASIGDYQRWGWMLPKINTDKYKVIDPLEKPKYIILTSYDYVKMELALISNKLQNYTWDKKYSIEWYNAQPPSEEVFQFYDNILNKKGDKYQYRLIKKFEKNIIIPIEFPPPQVRIYENEERLD